MTTKRTSGPCSEECMAWRTTHRLAVNNHLPDCPSLYPVQQEPDALTRLARHVRFAHDVSHVPQTATQVGEARERWTEQAIALISEAREEQRRAMDVAKREALTEAEDKIRAMSRELYATAYSDTLIGGAAGMVDAANAIAKIRGGK